MKEFPLPAGAGLAGGVPLPIEVPLPAEVQTVVVPAEPPAGVLWIRTTRSANEA